MPAGSLAFHEVNRRPGGRSYEEPVGRYEHPGMGSRPDAGSVPVTAGDLETSPAGTVAPVSTLPYAAGLMQSKQVNNLVVVEHPCGEMKKRDDIIKEVAK